MAAKKHHSSVDAKPEMGLHGLKELLKTREYLCEHCELLAPVVGIAAKATRDAAASCLRSTKKLAYLGLKRKPGASLTHPEVRFERAMFQRWSSHDGNAECGWHRIIDFQVPVKDRQKSVLGLKAIDLLGIDIRGLPVIIELKIVRKKTGADTPLLALLEAASYACILQADWSYLKSQLETKRKHLGITEPLQDHLKEIALVVAGPPEYWDFWNYTERASMIEAKPAFRSLIGAFRQEGFPVHFTCVEGLIGTPDQLSAKEAHFLQS